MDRQRRHAPYNDHVRALPLLSVFKFHVALAVLDKMDKQSISLDSIVSIKASQMPPNTYSLRKKFPDQISRLRLGN